MTYRIYVESGPLAGRHVLVTAPDDWQATATLAAALMDPEAVFSWPVPHLTDTADLFGSAPQVETITLSEAMRLMSEHAR